MEVTIESLGNSISSLKQSLADKEVLEERLNEIEPKYEEAQKRVSELEDKVADFNRISLELSNLKVEFDTKSAKTEELSER